jgi:hypothetical protein
MLHDEGSDNEEEKRRLRRKVQGSESNFRKWLKLLYTGEFMMEFLFLAVHPLPYVET